MARLLSKLASTNQGFTQAPDLDIVNIDHINQP